MIASLPHPGHGRFELRFRSLRDEGRTVAFPCDAAGRVDIDSLSERARLTYLYARTVIGREFGVPRLAASTRGDGEGPTPRR